MILPPATLGMLGGGQLGRFFVLAAHEMGYRVVVLDPDADCPAGRAADQHIVAPYDDYAALDELVGQCQAVSTEFENVPAASLAYLAKFVTVRPDASAVAICQNRASEKAFLQRHRLPHAPYAEIACEADLRQANPALFPGILKVARFGYDGKGQALVANREEAIAAWASFRHEPCVLEQKLSLDYEVSVVLARSHDGVVKCFPTVENRHRRGILDTTIAPARASPCLMSNAEELAEKIAVCMNYVGVLGVEFFVVRGQLIVNEMAPRPHNSGHFTLDACRASQFEQQVRALCGLPLADSRLHSPAVMVNLLGDLWYSSDAHRAKEPDWSKLLAVSGLKLHLYGKRHARPGRKMGHFTVIGENPENVLETAEAARRALGIRDD
ncbi:MAG: 5-(carboxyamino)imidazole ribonucleotide synthase [Rhodocyclaceae bacterium]|nr:5-(carboxyamino)imidazole ribonucleotide synthase [Rhodocyclaceae bacterium]